MRHDDGDDKIELCLREFKRMIHHVQQGRGQTQWGECLVGEISCLMWSCQMSDTEYTPNEMENAIVQMGWDSVQCNANKAKSNLEEIFAFTNFPHG